MSLSNRLDQLAKAPGVTPRPVVLFHTYGEPLPVPPPGVQATIITECVVDKIEPDGTSHIIDPHNPDGPLIVRRPGEELPDRTPREDGR